MDFQRLKTACSTCSLRDLCMPMGLTADELRQLDSFVDERRRIKRGERLYAAGSTFDALFTVRLGSLKTAVLFEDGREQVTGFHMLGELIGLDGISTEAHTCSAHALEDSEVCLLPFSRLEDFSRRIPALQHHVHRLLSSEIVREQHNMLLLGTMRAEEKLASFLLDLSDRYLRRGYSASEFVLRMTREEIGSFLGLKLETVSRLFSRFQEAGLIIAQQKYIKILDANGLRQLIGPPD
ncbi:MAG: fumarate/nitrate reduction transcriptional regulator Fnr [Betaproteobacteria bacterium]|nr:fumarate/nitrate reduction transcriptional regulator Fnr [Betaproteobacteria bacterium]